MRSSRRTSETKQANSRRPGGRWLGLAAYSSKLGYGYVIETPSIEAGTSTFIATGTMMGTVVGIAGRAAFAAIVSAAGSASSGVRVRPILDRGRARLLVGGQTCG
jgi:hypothetical protein